MSTNLSRIGEKARREPKLVFTSLYHHISDAENLRACYEALPGNRAAGVDGVTKEEYGRNVDQNLQEPSGRLRRMGYRPQPKRRTYIPKSGSEKGRPLGISCFEDKIVELAVKQVFEPIYEPVFEDSSHGYRPGRSQHGCLDELGRTIQRQTVRFVDEADIASFFRQNEPFAHSPPAAARVTVLPDGEEVKADPRHRFWGLYTHVWKLDVLGEAYRLVKKNNGAPRVDGQTFRQIEAEGVEGLLDVSSRELREKTYRPLPCRQVTIPKEGEKGKGLKIPAFNLRSTAGPRPQFWRSLALSQLPPLPRLLTLFSQEGEVHLPSTTWICTGAVPGSGACASSRAAFSG